MKKIISVLMPLILIFGVTRAVAPAKVSNSHTKSNILFFQQEQNNNMDFDMEGNTKKKKNLDYIDNYDLNFILQNITTSRVEILNDSFEIYGNCDLTDQEFRKIVKSGEPKVYFMYRTDRRIDLPYDALLKIKTNHKTYSYEFIEKESNDANFIKTGIMSFISKYSNVFANASYYALDSNVPMSLNTDVPTTFIDCVVEKEFVMRFDNKGYIVYHIAVSRYIANAMSIVFIVTVNNSFVPGIVAQKNDEIGYDSYYNQEGYVHMSVEQAYDANEEYYYGRRYGNVPYKKDYWPVNEPGLCVVSSSLQAGINLGYSFKNGFSLDNISVSEDHSIGANISFGYSKSITRSEPALSVQVNSANTNICEWYYTYSRFAAETNHLVTNYMFEISNSPNDMLIGDFRLKLDYKFIATKISATRPYLDTITKTGSADLIVRAGEYGDIYDFCSGMI